MRSRDFYSELEAFAPKTLSATWDNDGVMCRVPWKDEVKRVLVALDPTAAAIEYAAENGFDVLLTHHPLIFKGLKSLTGEDTVSYRTVKALACGVGVISLHTRLDAAQGGVNDALMAKLGIEVTGNFGDAEAPELGRLGELCCETDVRELALKVKNALGCGAVRVTGGGKVKKIAAVGGDGKDFIIPAMLCGADVLITGDAGYNAAEAAAEVGFTVIEAGHFHTEKPVCEVLAGYIRDMGIEAEVFDTCPSFTV